LIIYPTAAAAARHVLGLDVAVHDAASVQQNSSEN
jgi:hypothetical protein